MLSEKLSINQINELPNGLHDAEILDFTYDLTKASLIFTVNVWIGEMHPKEARETYRRGKLEFVGVTSFTKGEAEQADDGQLWFLDWEVKEGALLAERLRHRAVGKKFFSFYVLRCSMEIVCDGLYLFWSEPAVVR
jgi:hypothetical protein